MSLNDENNYHYKNVPKPIASPIPYQRQVSPESEREIYEKWLQKCQEDAIYNRKASEQNNFDRIKFSRVIVLAMFLTRS